MNTHISKSLKQRKYNYLFKNVNQPKELIIVYTQTTMSLCFDPIAKRGIEGDIREKGSRSWSKREAIKKLLSVKAKGVKD